jgi:hypothetical protein
VIGRETITVFLHRISALYLERLEAFLVGEKAGFIITNRSHSLAGARGGKKIIRS